MSAKTVTIHQAPLHARLSTRPLAEPRQSSDPGAWLLTLSLPLTAALELQCCPAALWSDDRSQWVFNSAATALIGAAGKDIRAGKDLWLDCVDPLDRERFLSVWQNLQSGADKMVCGYRFIPRAAGPTIELEESALRLAIGRSRESVILSRYHLMEPHKNRNQSSLRSLVHQIGNSLQSVRGEVDLLRLFGTLPQQSFDTIVQGIENIRNLTARLDDADRVKTTGYKGRKRAGRRCPREVRNGRT